MPAQSKAQQRFMGMVHATQKGDMEAPSKEVEKAADSMTNKDAKDYASTSHKGLPNKKENMKITKERLKELVEEVMTEESEYQAFFQKALEKTGKSIPDMSDEEKKEFFNKIDSAWQGKGEKKNEGNAFGAAVTDAKEKGEDEFEVGGEKFKVEEGWTPGPYVGLEMTPTGPKLVKTFSSGSQAYAWVMKSGGGHSIMTKKQWNLEEGKSDSVNEAKMDRSFLKKIEAVIKKDLGVSKLKVTGPHSSRFVGMETFFFSIDNPTRKIKVSKQDFGGMYEDFYDVILTNSLGHYLDDRDANFRRIPEKEVLKAVSTIAKNYKRILTYAAMKESVNEAASLKTISMLFQNKGIKESVNEVESDNVNWDVIENVFVNFLIKNTKELQRRVKAKHLDSTKKAIKSIISGLVNAQRSLKLESVNEVGELPAATIPASIKTKLVMAIDKIKDSKLNYNQKIQVIGQVMDSLGIDKSEFGRMSSKLKGTMESNIKEDRGPCWQGYKQVGMKDKGGRQVPNCVKEGKMNEAVAPKDMDKIKSAVEAASSFMGVGSELKKLGMKYTFATEPLAIYIVQPTPNNKVAIVNKRYASKPDFVVGDIAVGIMEGIKYTKK